MTEEKIQDFRERTKPQLRAYLKASHIETDENTTVCPICGDMAGLMKNDTWLCMTCRKSGDLLDYVLHSHPRMKPGEAVRHIQRTLGEQITELEAVNANELMDMEFQPTGWLIEKLLGKGVYILAGASKIGKSWLVLWLADRVSKGENVWEFKTKACEVLYVSLEDTAQRIQSRLSEVTGGEADKVWIATEAELLGKGFEQQICNFLMMHPAVGFVIVDTLQRIRQVKTEGYSYGGDYEVMTALKSIADRFNITILVVHHTRKEESEDAFNMISGTNGLLGCADGAMVLQKQSRIGRTATLDVTGREIPDIQLKLEFDDSKHWQFIEYGKEEPRDNADKLLTAVKQLVLECKEWKGTPTELVSALAPTIPSDTKPHSLTRRLNASTQTLAQQYGVQYQSKRTMDSREITLSSLAS
jgi:hypothetical protein